MRERLRFVRIGEHCEPRLQRGTLDSSTTHIDLEFDGITRSYEIHLPPSYDGTTPTPLVLNFHGFTSSGLGQQASSNMDVTADAGGFTVAYPNGLDQSWNAGLCCGRSATLDVDDVGFTRAVIGRYFCACLCRPIAGLRDRHVQRRFLLAPLGL